MRIGITVSYLRERIFILYQRNLSIGSNQTNQPRTLIRTRAVHRRVGKWSKRANGQNPDPKLKKKQKKTCKWCKAELTGQRDDDDVPSGDVGGGHSSDRRWTLIRSLAVVRWLFWCYYSRYSISIVVSIVFI
jgi:hypothetical protein